MASCFENSFSQLGWHITVIPAPQEAQAGELQIGDGNGQFIKMLSQNEKILQKGLEAQLSAPWVWTLVVYHVHSSLHTLERIVESLFYAYFSAIWGVPRP